MSDYKWGRDSANAALEILEAWLQTDSPHHQYATQFEVAEACIGIRKQFGMYVPEYLLDLAGWLGERK